MLRAIILLALLGGLLLFISPIVISSVYLDQRGIDLTGHVYSKREDVTVHNSDWARASDVTFKYESPESSSTAFFSVSLPPEEYDQFHVGQPVKLHYLRHRDIPKLPGAEILWQVHILPMVRLASQRAFAGVERFFTANIVIGCEVFGAAVILLWIWRRTRLPGFGWAVGICVLIAVPVLFFYDFPRPTPEPAAELRQAAGKVKSVDHITHLMETSRRQGMPASQPIEVVGIEFVPEGKTDSVLAVDLIDAGSLPGLKQGAPVNVEYEAARPRTAYLTSGTRGFLRRNLLGLVGDGALYVGALVGLLMLATFIGKAWNRFLVRQKIR